MGAAATGQLFAASMVSGTLTLATANTPYNLLTLIQAQLDPNCPGAGYEVNIQADSTGPVYVGRPNPVVGALSTSNYGYVLDKAQSGFVGGSARTYRSSFPGSHSPIGDLWVMGTAANTTIHVEVM